MAEVKVNDPIAEQARQRLPSNSITANRPVEPKPIEKVKPVVKGKAVVQKDTFGKKVWKTFVPTDLKDIRAHAVNQIIVPGLKAAALSLVELALYGSVGNRRSTSGVAQRTNYSYISSGNHQTNTPAITQKDRATHNFQNIIFATYQDAEDVISTMLDLADRYNRLTVAQFYDLAGLESDWASENWGWTSFQRLETKAVRGGYIIDVSPPVLLN